MSLVKISALPVATSLSASDMLPLLNGGANKQIAFANLKSSLGLGTVAALDVGNGPLQIPQVDGSGYLAGSILLNAGGLQYIPGGGGWVADANAGDRTVSLPANSSGDQTVVLAAVLAVLKAIKADLHSRLLPSF